MIALLFADPFNLIIIIGVALIILELILGAATGFELFVFGLIVIAGGFAGKYTESYYSVGAVIVILTALYIFIGRKFIKQSLNITTHHTNTESIIERKGVVVVDITPDQPGQIKIDGEIWRARARMNIKKGENIRVKSVSGVTVKVEPDPKEDENRKLDV